MSGKSSILSAINDATAWLDVLEGFATEMRDLYFRPEWVSLHCLEEGAEGMGFVYEEGGKDGGERWFYSFIKRPVLQVGKEDVSELGLSDIESAYGYGGPISSVTDADFLKRARSAFEVWCREQKVVAEFLRFHPLLKTEQFIGCSEHVTVIDDRPTAAMHLLKETVSEGYSKNAAYMIRRGGRAGYRVIEVGAEQMPQFVKMYRETMEMLGATDYYHFSENYYADLEKLVSKNGRLLAVVGEDDKKWVSAGIFLDGEIFSHYHLSASITTCRVPGATNLLLDHAAQLAAGMGKSFLHLGGGRTAAEDDSLLKFKKEMGSEECRFHIGKCVHLQDEYDDLINRWEKQGGVSAGNPVLLRYRQTV